MAQRIPVPVHVITEAEVAKLDHLIDEHDACLVDIATHALEMRRFSRESAGRYVSSRDRFLLAVSSLKVVMDEIEEIHNA